MRRHPSYLHAKNQLESGEFISVHQCLADFWDPFLDTEDAKENIMEALRDYRDNGRK